MPKLFKATIIAVTLMALGACRDTSGEDLFEVTGKLFIFNYRVATATYLVTLGPLKPMREGDVAVATFENPAGGEPLVVRQKIWPKLNKTTLESPPLKCVVKNHPYAVAIRIEDADGALLQAMDFTMVSSEDQTLLPDRPLVVGPVYTPNPELAGKPDGKLHDGADKNCPTI